LTHCQPLMHIFLFIDGIKTIYDTERIQDIADDLTSAQYV
jgi:hypothetical protein